MKIISLAVTLLVVTVIYFTLPTDGCGRCADHCVKCKHRTPRLCVKCETGYMVKRKNARTTICVKIPTVIRPTSPTSTSTVSPTPTTYTFPTRTPSVPTNTFAVYGMAFASKRSAISFGPSPCTGQAEYGEFEDESGRLCCDWTEVFVNYDYYCYSDFVGGATEISGSCPYIAFGQCYTGRYFLGPCAYDACCAADEIYYEWSCYGKSTSSLLCPITVNGDCYFRKYVYGPCPYSRCCASDETYYNQYCYYNDAAVRQPPSKTATYSISGQFYVGRTYSGQCTSEECCPFLSDLHYNNHCYRGPTTAADVTVTFGVPHFNCYQVHNLCFTDKGFSDSAACDTGYRYGSICCNSTSVFYDYDYRCYSGQYIVGNLPTCTYTVYGQCYDNRYWYGTCQFTACCGANGVYGNDGYCQNSQTGARSNLGPCDASLCCAVDETFFNGYCYYNGTETRTATTVTSYTVNGQTFYGRRYTGECFAFIDQCCYGWKTYYQNYCYTNGL